MDLLAQIQEEIGKFRTLEKANDHVATLKYEIDKAYAELTEIEKKLDKEYREYEKLEGRSLKGFFYNVLGNKEAQLEKERQDYLQLSLQFDEKKESIKLKEFELGVLEKKVKDFKASQQRLEQLKKKRENYLLSNNSPEGSELRSIIDEMDDHTLILIDIDEALAVANTLLGKLGKMLELLKSARNWGRWDMSSGSHGRMTKYHKHTNIDRAKRIAYEIQNLMDHFDREVKDVYPEFTGFQRSPELGSFNKFTDIFFDNLISDWIVQQKIVNSYNNVRAINDRVSRIQQSLEQDEQKHKSKIENLNHRKDALIMGK